MEKDESVYVLLKLIALLEFCVFAAKNVVLHG